MLPQEPRVELKYPKAQQSAVSLANMAASLSSFGNLLVAEATLSARHQTAACQQVRRPGSLSVVAVKKVQGTVVSTANEMTAAVEVKRIYAHPLYKKRITSVKRYQAHDPENKCKVGDFVTLVKCAPVSKSKKFLVVDIKAPRVPGVAAVSDELPPLESAA